MVSRKTTRRRSTQVRGDVRRSRIMSAALSLLNTEDVSYITYSDVGRLAQIPLGSMHFFFPDLQSIYQAILESDNRAICERIAKPLAGPQTQSWRAAYLALLDRGVKYMRGNAGVSQLVISGKTSFELKRRNRQLHGRMAALLEGIIDTHIELPRMPKRTEKFFVAVEIFDLILTLSVVEHGKLTTAMTSEAKKASAAYLALYFDEALPRRTGEKPAHKRD